MTTLENPPTDSSLDAQSAMQQGIHAGAAPCPELIVPEWPVPAGIGSISTTRRGGFSMPPYDDGAGCGGLNLGMHVSDDAGTVERNRQLLAARLPSGPVWLTQVHGTRVLDLDEFPGEPGDGTGTAPEADAAITSVRQRVCAIMTADCLPVLFASTDGKVVGAAHAGWRGLVNGILEHTVAAMRAKGAAEVVAWMGPAIGPAQFEVGQDVADAFLAHSAGAAPVFSKLPGPATGTPGGAKYLADIFQLARQRLSEAGVASVYGGNWCTVTDRDRLFSYRRDKTTGRMATLIWIK